MSEPVKIKHADVFNGDGVLITLSNDRVLHLTLEQLMNAHPQMLPADDAEEDLAPTVPD